MSTPTTRKRTHARIDRRRTRCTGPHQFPEPLAGRRPVVVFCVQCQAGKDVR